MLTVVEVTRNQYVQIVQTASRIADTERESFLQRQECILLNIGKETNRQSKSSSYEWVGDLRSKEWVPNARSKNICLFSTDFPFAIGAIAALKSW